MELCLLQTSTRRSAEGGILTVLCDHVNVSGKAALLLNSLSEIAKYLLSDLLSSFLSLCSYAAFINFIFNLTESLGVFLGGFFWVFVLVLVFGFLFLF